MELGSTDPLTRAQWSFVDLSAFPLFMGFISGGPRHSVELVRELVRRGSKVDIVGPPSERAILDWAHVQVNRLHLVEVPFETSIAFHSLGIGIVYLARLLRSFPTVIRAARSSKLLVSCTTYLVDLIPAALARAVCPECSLVVCLHHVQGGPFERSRHHPLLPSLLNYVNEVIARFLIKRAADVVVANPVYLPLVRRPVKMKQGIDFNTVTTIRANERTADAGFLGRLAPVKGIFDLVEIWRLVVKERPRATLVIIGTEKPSFVNELKKRIKLAKLQQNVFLLGTLPGGDERKFAQLKGCRVFVFPSYEEGWGIAILEAMACGLPVVAYDLPAYEPLGGVFVSVPIGDKSAMAKAVLNLLLDDKLHDDLSIRAQKFASQFDWPIVAEVEIESILTELFGARSKQPEN